MAWRLARMNLVLRREDGKAGEAKARTDGGGTTAG